MSPREPVRRKLLTVVAESAIERPIVEEIKRLGARGYTIVAARGEGSRGVRQGSWEQNGSVEIQVVCTEATARAIMECLHDRFYADFAMVAWASDVEILRGEKF
jgi:hypothetical protein